MNRIPLLLLAIFYLPLNAFAHSGHIEWSQFATSGYFEWLEASFVITAFIFYLLSTHFDSHNKDDF